MLATAHYRNGVLLGPLTGRLVAAQLQSDDLLPELAPFALDRFTPCAGQCR
jgi:glycine/D-amino acid oxidase-like deaminating enzyme